MYLLCCQGVFTCLFAWYLSEVDDMLTVTQAASELGIQPGAVRDAIARGSMQAVRVGGRGVRAGLLLIQRHELERYQRDIKGKPGPKPKAPDDTMPA